MLAETKRMEQFCLYGNEHLLLCVRVYLRERKSPCRVRVCRRMNVLCMLTHIILTMYRFDVCVCVNVSLCFPMFCVCVLCGLSFNFGVTSYSPEFRAIQS